MSYQPIEEPRIPTRQDDWDEDYRCATGAYPEFSRLGKPRPIPIGGTGESLPAPFTTTVKYVTWPDDLRGPAPTGNLGTK